MGHFFLHLLYRRTLLSTYTRTKQQQQTTTIKSQTNKKKGKEIACSSSFSGFFSQCKAHSITVLKAARKWNLLEGRSGSY